jgi:AcrR family transcriptional regulator
VTVPDVGDVGVAPGAPARDQRTHILDRALGLMSERGSAATSMRTLATACGLNVATIYHYFPSKADLLRALIEEQRYGERLHGEDPPIAAELPPRERFATLLTWVWGQTEGEHVVLRLILGEAVRGDATAQLAARDLIQVLDTGIEQWMADGFPELAARGITPALAGRLVRRQLLSLAAEHLAAGKADGSAAARELAAVLFD